MPPTEKDNPKDDIMEKTSRKTLLRTMLFPAFSFQKTIVIITAVLLPVLAFSNEGELNVLLPDRIGNMHAK